MTSDFPRPLRFCLACGAENARSAALCRRCGRRLEATAIDQRRGAAFMLNELEGLHEEREIEGGLYLRLRARYLPFLREPASRPEPTARPEPAARRSAVVPEPARPRPPTPAPRAAPQPAAQPQGPGWLVEQQANLLLYLGAFLTVIAALVYVGYSGQAIDDRIKMAMLSAYTLAFLVAGLACNRWPRARQAGVVFFGVGALMVPINFVGAYGFFYAEQDLDPTGLWLAGSIVSALFYAAIAYAGLGEWYAVPMVGSAISSLTATLVLAGAPPEAYPGSYIALSLVLAVPQILPLGRATKLLGPAGALAAHAMVPGALLVALGMAAFDGGDSHQEELFVLMTRWYLPPTVAMAALFYWAQALAAPRVARLFEEGLAIAALAVTGGAGMTLVYALGVGHVWYGPAVAALGWAYAAAAVATTGSRWAGQRYLGLLALGATTASWTFFEGPYADMPRHGAAVHLAAAAFYLIAARVTKERFPLLPDVATDENGRPKALDVDAAVPLFYAGALALGIGVYEITSAAHGVAALEAQNATWVFFAASLAAGVIAATMRWWWRELRLHGYAVAFGLSCFVLTVAAPSEGQVTAILAVDAAVVLALAVWEREPTGLAPASGYAFFALLAAWRFYEPNDAALPLILSRTAGALFAASVLLRPAAERLGLDRPSALWATVLQAIAFAYATAAPITGGVRLSILADHEGLIDGTRFEETLLFRFSAISVALLAIAGGTTRWWWRDVKLPVYAVAFGMSCFVLTVAAGSEGQVTAMLAVCAAVVLALAVWEREPMGLAPAASYAFFALLAAWRFYEPNDAALPLILSGTAGALFAASVLLRPAAERLGLDRPSVMWATVLQAIAFAYATAAPVVGGVRLSLLVDYDGLIGGTPFEETLLFRLSAISVALLAVAGGTTRWWWRDLRLPVFGTALVMSLATVLASTGAEGQMILLLLSYGALALALSVWQREPIALVVPAGFGFAALLATWHHYEPHEAFLPLAVSGIGWALFVTAIALRPAARRLGWSVNDVRWRAMLHGIGMGYAIAAPITGWALLARLADPSGMVGTERFEETLLYQTSAASVALLALLIAVHWPIVRRVELAFAASALAMVGGLLEIGHFHPENAQAYTAPLGAYLLGISLIALRLRWLPMVAWELVSAGEVLGAALIMGPTFVQSLDENAWRYGLIVLGEGIGFVALALVQRRVWLLGAATTFVVMDGAHYLFFAGGPALPNWAILAIAGTAVMAAGTAILLGRERWTEWQRAVQSWWYREAPSGCDTPATPGG